MPATFAAAARAMAAGAERLPGFSPASLLDLGAGPGATAWAATAVWPALERVVALERERTTLELGRRLAEDRSWTWRLGDVAASRLDPVDVVAAGYLLGELEPDAQARLVDRAWAATRGALVLVEPGSPAGFERILAARDRLISAGARIVAPCPGEADCPVAASRTAWCHFLARLERSPLHRATKRAARSWEDEPFSYVVAARPSPEFVWVEGYWAPQGKHYRWNNGYWTRPPYAGAYWVEPYYYRGSYIAGYWEGGRRDHDRRDWKEDRKHRR